MLKSVLKSEECASCRFCCSFRRQSLWELPRLPMDYADKYKTNYLGEKITYDVIDENGQKYLVTGLSDKYKTDDSEEEVPCPFLNPASGCTLPDNDKPFECKAWPLRYMRLADNSLKVCLTPTCPAINKVDIDILKEKTKESWGDEIKLYAHENPYIIKDYKDGFPILE